MAANTKDVRDPHLSLPSSDFSAVGASILPTFLKTSILFPQCDTLTKEIKVVLPRIVKIILKNIRARRAISHAVYRESIKGR